MSQESRPAWEWVLIVDDEPDIAKIVAMVLIDAGFNVLTATSAQEALRIVTTREQKKLPLDQLWTDNRMPDPGDGINLIRCLHERSLTSKMTNIVLMSATIDQDITPADRALFELHGWEFLPKPFKDLQQITDLAKKGRARPSDTQAT